MLSPNVLVRIVRLRAWIFSQRGLIAEWFIIALVAYFYAGASLLNFDAQRLQQTGEHNESATLPILTELSLWRYHEIPVWNPFMLTGFPVAGDFINHFWNPVSTFSILAFGGINGMKFSVFVSLVIAGIGQWLLAHVFGLRGIVRLWTAILFMLSGGIALFWRVGWYGLLLGVVWFPWCYAALWWALARQDRTSLVLTGFCIAMVLTTGGGYYPFYLSASLGLLFVISVWMANAKERWFRFRRTLYIALLALGLVAVVYFPLVNGAIFTRREAPPDREQRSSQPIQYALMNYAISQPEWFRAEILGGQTGYNWFYIGVLPVAALAFVPLAWRDKKYRVAILVVFSLTLFLLLWHSNRYTVFKYIYDWIPELYTLRFPNRLLVVAASPLLILTGLGIAYLYQIASEWSLKYSLAFSIQRTEAQPRILSAARAIVVIFVLVLGYSAWDVFSANKAFAFAPPDKLDTKSFAALSWLKDSDPDLYYINIGAGSIYWWWTPAAYSLEMPVINFQYNRYLASQPAQRDPNSPFVAKPKYIIAQSNQPTPAGARRINEFEGVGVWQIPEVLPFAFSARSSQFQPKAALAAKDVAALNVSLDGMNRVVVKGSGTPAEKLVVLVSYYPGWQLSIDGKPAVVEPINGYLGAAMLPGEHTYVFSFQLLLYEIGFTVSLIALLVAFGMMASEFSFWRRLKPGSSSVMQ